MTSTSQPSHRGVSHGGTVASGAQSCRVLRELLTSQGPYRRRWRAEVRRASRNDPHQSAVAQVLAQHLWDIGEVPESDVDLPRRLKDVVARAVGGTGMSHQTLGWFVGAFDMNAEDEQALWRALEDDLRAEDPGLASLNRPGPQLVNGSPEPVPGEAEFVPGGTAPASGGAAEPTGAAPIGPYRTQSLIEQFEIGADRSRRRHSLVHILRAHEPLDRLTYRFDNPEVEVSVVRGGRAGGLIPDFAPGMFSLEVLLPTPLAPGQATVIETVASYPPGGEPVTEFRRALRATAGGVSLQVAFDPQARPGRLRWAEFEHRSAGELVTEDTTLSADGVAHRFLTPQRDCVVGFEWDW